MGQFHFQQVEQLGLGLEFLGHIVVKHPHATLAFHVPHGFKLRLEFTRIKRFLRGKALLFTFQAVAAQLAEMAFEQVAIDQRVTVVECQRQPPTGGSQLVQHRQNAFWFGQPFEHRMAQHQVIGFGELAEQVLPGCLNERCRLACLGKAFPGAIEHRRGGFGEGQVMAALGQPQGHVTKPGADVQHPQRPVRQGFGQVGLEHGQADRALGTSVDLLGKTGGQLIEVTVVHRAKRLSLSASLARTTCSMSRPSSLHSSNR